MRYRLVVRLTPADVGKRVVIRWRPGPGDSEQVTDVLGILEQADAGSFAVRTREGNLVVIPAGAGPAPSLPDRRPADAAWPLSRRPPAAAHPACDRPCSEALEAFAASWQDRCFAGGQDSSGCAMSLGEALKTNPGTREPQTLAGAACAALSRGHWRREEGAGAIRSAGWRDR